MKISNRLWLSFFLMILMPIFILLIVVGEIVAFQLKQAKDTYGGKNGDYSILTNTTQAYENVTRESFLEIRQSIRENPERAFSEIWQARTQSELDEKNISMIIRKGKSVVFNGSGIEDLNTMIPGYKETDEDSVVTITTSQYDRILLRQIDFRTNSGEKGSVFLAITVRGILPEVENMVQALLVGVLGVFLISGIGMTMWASRGIVLPLRRLESATKRIREGDLNFTVETGRSDEIGELCKNFEQMRKRLKESSEEKLEQEQQYKILISNICHDLKTPITSIQGYVEGLMDGVANTPEKQEKYIRTIYNKASELNVLINELTIYSKLDTNRIPYNFQVLNVNGYFSDCMEELEVELETKGISLSYENNCDGGTGVIADPEQLTRVIHNIVSNAVKYMNKPEGRILLRVKDVGDFVQIEIEDTGKGIAARDLPFIFDRFFRADSSRNETKGSGIGLSIVKKIINDHGGQIWATSTENVGTTMYFVLRKYQEGKNE